MVKAPRINYFDNYEIMVTLQNEHELAIINERIYHPQAVLMKTIVNDSGTHRDFIEVKIDRCSNTFTNQSNNWDLLGKYDSDIL